MERSNTLYFLDEAHEEEFKMYINEKLELKKAIKLTKTDDVLFSNMAQMASVGGATLPSGLKIPSGNWKVVKNYIIKDCIYI